VSISPRSHRAKVDASSSLNNCNASLLREGCACATTCCTVRHFRRRWLLWSYGVSYGSADFVRCLARCCLYRRSQCSRADFDVSWLNSTGALICGTRFSKESICSSFCWASGCYWRATKAIKALPCCAMSARIRSCMSSGIVWRIYVRLVANIDIKILGIMKCWSRY